MIGISGSLIWSKTLMELIFNPCGEYRWRPEGPVSQIHSPHLHAGAPGIFSDLLRSVQMLKREWGAESNGKLLHLFIPSKTATLVLKFAVEDLSLGRTAALVPEFAVKDLQLGRTPWWWWWYYKLADLARRWRDRISLTKPCSELSFLHQPVSGPVMTFWKLILHNYLLLLRSTSFKIISTVDVPEDSHGT